MSSFTALIYIYRAPYWDIKEVSDSNYTFMKVSYTFKQQIELLTVLKNKIKHKDNLLGQTIVQCAMPLH